MILSIIVPCFNCEKFLERCLESLIHQDLQPELYEIIVVDDGSYDNSKVFVWITLIITKM